MQLDAELFGDELAALIREHVAAAVKPLQDRIVELEATIANAPTPINGKDADPDVVRAMVYQAVAEQPKPQDGKSIDPGAVFAEIGAAVARAVEALPKPKDGQPGKDADMAALRSLIIEKIESLPPAKDGQPGAKGEPGAPGKDADPAALASFDDRIVKLGEWTGAQHDVLSRRIDAIDQASHKVADGATVEELREQLAEVQMSAWESAKALEAHGQQLSNVTGRIDAIDQDWPKEIDTDSMRAMVQEAVSAIPPAKDGEPGKDGKPGKDVDLADLLARIPTPKDGKDADPLLVRELVAEAVAAIPPAKDGKSVDPKAIGKMIRAEVERAIAEIPPAENGLPGKDGTPGVDGFSLEHFDAEMDGRKLRLILRAGNREVVREFLLPVPMDAGVYASGKGYDEGDCVTYGGSLWIAQQNTAEAPGNGKTDWRLAVKRGKDAS